MVATNQDGMPVTVPGPVSGLEAQGRSSNITALSAGAATVTVAVNSTHAHWYAAVEYFSDSTADTPVSPTAGTATFTVATPLLPNTYQSITNGVINANANQQVNWNSPTNSVKCVLASISGNSAAYVIVRVVGVAL